jgi:hypothetical protein
MLARMLDMLERDEFEPLPMPKKITINFLKKSV